MRVGTGPSRRQEVWHGGVPDVKHPRPPPASGGGEKGETDGRCLLAVGLFSLGEARGLCYELVGNADRSLISAQDRFVGEPEAIP